jgi:hypothetical protein
MATPVKTGSGLKPSSGLSHSRSHASIEWHTFPVAASLWSAAQRTSHRSQLNIDALSSVLHSHGITTRFEEPGAPCSCYVHPSRECRVEVRYFRLVFFKKCVEGGKLTVTDSQRAVLQTDAWKIETRDCASIANTRSTFPSHASSQIYLLKKSEFTDESLSFLVGICPSIAATHPRGWIIRRGGLILAVDNSCQCRNGCN